MSDVLDIAASAWRVTINDMKSLFNQFELAESDRWLTTTVFGAGEYYHFVGAPFGLASILATAQRFMDRHFKREGYQACYVDDALTAHMRRGDWDAAVRELIAFYKQCNDVNLAVNIDKLQLLTAKPDLLGHVVDCVRAVFYPRPTRMQVLAEFSRPTNNVALKRFISMAAVWARFLPGWAMLSKRMSSIIQKGSTLNWTRDAIEAFEQARELLASSCVATKFDPAKPTEIFTDAGKYGIGYVVAQPDEYGMLRLIVAGGRACAPYEQDRLHVAELEFLAFRECCYKEPHYVLGLPHPPVWRTDNRAVQHIRTQKMPAKSSAVRRWLAEMQHGDLAAIRVLHVSGSANPADAIGRQFDPAPTTPTDGTPFEHIRDRLLRAPVLMATLAPMDDLQPPESPPHTPALTDMGDLEAPVQDDDDEVEPEPDRAPPASATLDSDELFDEPELAPLTVDTVESEQATALRDAAVHEFVDATTEAQLEAHDEIRAQAQALVRDRSRWAKELRLAATGQRAPRRAVDMRPFFDAFGRLFVRPPAHPTRALLYVPDALLDELIWLAHFPSTTAAGGHRRSAKAIRAAIGMRFFAPSLTDERISSLISSRCSTCAQLAPRQSDGGNLGTDPRAPGRFHHVCMDLAELDDAPDGRYLLVIVDRATGTVELPVLKTKKAEVVADAFERSWLLRHGAPKIVTLDRAPELRAPAMQQLAERWHFKIDPITAYNPQANGLAERTVQTVKTAIRALMPLATEPADEFGPFWTDFVDMARWSYMCAISSARGSSPFELERGVPPRVPLDNKWLLPDQLFGNTPPTHVAKSGPAAIAEWRVQQAKFAAEQLTERGRAMRQRRHELDRERAARAAGGAPIEFVVGDVVWLENSGNTHGSKFRNMIKRLGPFEVTRVDARRFRVKLKSWRTQQPLQGWFPWRRLSRCTVALEDAVPQLHRDEDSDSADLLPQQQSESVENDEASANSSAAASYPLHIPSKEGVILDVMQSEFGWRLLVDSGFGAHSWLAADFPDKKAFLRARTERRALRRRERGVGNDRPQRRA